MQVIVLLLLGVFVFLCWLAWPALRDRFGFGDSESIFLARFQVLFGTLMALDLTPLLSSWMIPYYIIGAGLLSELARRNRAYDL